MAETGRAWLYTGVGAPFEQREFPLPDVNPAWLVHQNRRMVGVGGYQSWALRRGLELLERTRGRYPYEKILSHRFPLEQINEAFAHADQGKAVRTALICAPDVTR